MNVSFLGIIAADIDFIFILSLELDDNLLLELIFLFVDLISVTPERL